jgi:hypothetical protein
MFEALMPAQVDLICKDKRALFTLVSLDVVVFVHVSFIVILVEKSFSTQSADIGKDVEV